MPGSPPQRLSLVRLCRLALRSQRCTELEDAAVGKADQQQHRCHPLISLVCSQLQRWLATRMPGASLAACQSHNKLFVGPGAFRHRHTCTETWEGQAGSRDETDLLCSRQSVSSFWACRGALLNQVVLLLPPPQRRAWEMQRCRAVCKQPTKTG